MRSRNLCMPLVFGWFELLKSFLLTDSDLLFQKTSEDIMNLFAKQITNKAIPLDLSDDCELCLINLFNSILTNSNSTRDSNESINFEHIFCLCFII